MPKVGSAALASTWHALEDRSINRSISMVLAIATHM